MSPRKPSPEELLLWRESNKHTRKHMPDVAIDTDLRPQQSAPASAPIVAKEANKTAKPPKPKPPLAPLSAREAKRHLARHPSIEATLDLHGETKIAAYGLVQQFIARQHAAGRRHVLIITGKGRMGEGILREALPDWLNEPMLRRAVASFVHARPEKGGNGVMHVLLRKHRE